MLFGTELAELRSLNRRRFGKPLAAVFISAFRVAPDLYLGRRQLLSPDHHAAGQPAASYPDDRAQVPRKHGLLDQQEYERRPVQQGNPEAVVEYPLSDPSYGDKGSGYNLLMIVVDGIRAKDVAQDMLGANALRPENVRFSDRLQSGNHADTGLFGLFYGISRPIWTARARRASRRR